MLNIISRSIVSGLTTGPRKVAENLMKGLDELNYPYLINARLDACKRIWIHDDKKALEEVVKIKDVCVIAGPNLYVTPKEIPNHIDISNIVYIQPSPWVIEFWQEQGFDRSQIAAWPTGIDTNIFTPSKENKSIVLIYFKNRNESELEYARKQLSSLSIDFKIIRYGRYKEEEYLESLKHTKYIIWIGSHESQGLALQEALSCNIPIIVWDTTNLIMKKSRNSFSENNFYGATSAYYFDDRCGVIIKEKELLRDKLFMMEKEFSKFSPREYILENLSTKKQAQDFIDLYKIYFNLSFTAGLQEKQIKEGVWRNGTTGFRLYQKLKDTVKMIIK